MRIYRILFKFLYRISRLKCVYNPGLWLVRRMDSCVFEAIDESIETTDFSVRVAAEYFASFPRDEYTGQD